MIADFAIYSAANIIAKQYGKDALIHTTMRADAMLEADDRDGHAAFKRILRAIEELQGVGPKPGEAVH